MNHYPSDDALTANRFSIRELVYLALFCSLIAIGAFIRVPVPVVPFTLQFLFTMLAGTLLGGRLGALSVSLYIGLGLIGLPIFAEGGGLWYVFKPSFGYLLGFALASYVTGRMSFSRPDPGIGWLLAANFIGLAIVYAAGLSYYYIMMNFVLETPIALGPLFLYGFVLAVPGDILLCIVAAFITQRVRKLRPMGV